MGKPQLTFFCELKGEDLKTIFAEPDLIADLKELGAGLSLGILDLSPERAEVVKALNQAGIPLTAWLLLPEEEGYWFNIDNLSQARAFYLDFRSWTCANDLDWEAVGLDIEPNRREMTQFAHSKARFLPVLVKRLFERRQVQRARRGYQNFVDRIRGDGYRVECYHYPFILDERSVGSDLLQRLTRLVDFEADRDVWMIYSSDYRPNGPGFLWCYGADCGDCGSDRPEFGIGLGSTGGGVDTGLGDSRPLKWQELARDLRLAWYWCDELYIFSLEGCIRQGFLPYLKSFQWDQVSMVPYESAQEVARFRSVFKSVLWTSARLPALLIGSLIAWWSWSWLRKRVEG